MRSFVLGLIVAAAGCQAHGHAAAGASATTPRAGGAPSASGEDPPGLVESFQAVIQSHTHDVTACYNAALRRDADLAGRIEVEIVIAQGGAVGSAKIVSASLTETGMQACILRTVNTWKFSNPTARAIVVRNPFDFQTAPTS